MCLLFYSSEPPHYSLSTGLLENSMPSSPRLPTGGWWGGAVAMIVPQLWLHKGRSWEPKDGTREGRRFGLNYLLIHGLGVVTPLLALGPS